MTTPAASHELPPEVPLGALFGNPDRQQPRLSPDGRYYAFLADRADGVVNVFLQRTPTPSAPSEQHEPVQLTDERERPLRFFTWARSASPRRVLFVQDKGGDENFHLFVAEFEVEDLDDGAIRVANLSVRDLTPFDGSTVPYDTITTSAAHPDEVLVALNHRDARLFDAVRINISSGEVVTVVENPGTIAEWVVTDDFQVRGGASMNPADGSITLSVGQPGESDATKWEVIATWPHGEIGNIHSFNKDGTGIFVESTIAHGKSDDVESGGYNTSRLVVISTEDGRELQLLASDPKCDVGVLGVSFNEIKRTPEYCIFDYDSPRVHVLDEELRDDIELLVAASYGAFSRVSATDDDNVWIVIDKPADASPKYYIYDRATKHRSLLFDSRPALAKYQLAPMEPRVIKTSDGYNMVVYLTLPVGIPARNLPFVLRVHGGPWHRDAWGYNPEHQFFANRGYGCLSVNFRGSTGYGKLWTNLGDQQWGATMQQDLTDSVQWLIDEGLADKDRIAIYGGSYGGYATLAGLAFTPELYACGVDIVGPSNAKTLLGSIPPYWETMRKMLILRVGDVENDDQLNRRISPLYHAEKICRPLLIAQGANDPRVKQAESDQIAKKLYENKHPVTYVLYPDEGHGFARQPNKLDFTSRVEKFLAEYLGGRSFPVDPTLIEGSTGKELDVSAL